MAHSARQTALQTVFDQWLNSRPGKGPRAGTGALAETSARLYRDMWAVFMQFQLSRPKRRSTEPSGLTGVRALDLQAFIEAAPTLTGQDKAWSDRYTWRMLHLIDRVLRFHRLQSGVRGEGLTAAGILLRDSTLRFANAAHLDGEPQPLAPLEAKRVRQHLERSLKSCQRQDPTQVSWKSARDIAAVAVMLGAGLAPGDVQSLASSSLQFRAGQAWIDVPADGLSPAHRAPLADWAVPMLAHWLAVRDRVGIPGTVVFPSTAKGSPLSRMSCHRRTVAVLEAAQVDGGVPFRLRHTCAVAWLRAGHGEEQVAEWLGLIEPKALRRYAGLATRARSTG